MISALALGVSIGFYYNWKLALLMLAFVPFLVVGTYIRTKLITRNKIGLDNGNSVEESVQVSR